MKKRVLVLLVLVMALIIMACSKKGGDKNKAESLTPIPNSELDWSENVVGTDEIMNAEITEIRVSWVTNVYRITDKQVIEEIKRMISELELVSVDDDYVNQAIAESEDKAGGDHSEMSLIVGNEIKCGLSSFMGKYVTLNKNYYKPSEEFYKIFTYCQGFCYDENIVS